MDALVERLIEQETLDGDEFRRIVEASDAPGEVESGASTSAEAVAAVS
jgi:hypothetical protein